MKNLFYLAADKSYNRRHEDLPEEFANTVLAIAEISGKSIQPM